MLSHVHALYRFHILARDRAIAIDAPLPSVSFRSDPTILSRVLGNLVKNALEATPPGGAVTVGCEGMPDGGIRFSVRNPVPIPEAARTQIFKRSFSTKGVGRGLGTYSARLLTEKYLGGSICFATGIEEGTVFHVTLPSVSSTLSMEAGNTK